MRPIYVILDKEGNLWQKESRDNRRGVYAFKSEAKALAVLKQTHTEPNKVVIQKYEATEHNSRGRNWFNRLRPKHEEL